jgi:hypothetical protein
VDASLYRGRVNGAAAIALVGAAVGAVLTFSLSQIDARLRRRRQGRTAAKLIWFELMDARATVRTLKTDGMWIGDRPFATQAWHTERSAFVEVADDYAFAVVGLAYHQMAGLQRTYDELASLELLASEETSPQALARAQARGPKIPASLPQDCFDALEIALVQLDRYSGLAKEPVDYAELDKQSAISR